MADLQIVPGDYEILVVDDVPSNRALMAAVLKHAGYRMRQAVNAAEALAEIRREAPDLVLLDVMMPEMNGFEACRYIRQEMGLTHLPIILLTALHSTEDILHGFSVKASDYVSKPFNNKVLLKRIEFQLSKVAYYRLLKQRTAELEESVLFRDKLYSVLAHDMRSPIANAKSVTNYLISKLPAPGMDDETTAMLWNLNSVVDQAYALFENVLSWTKSQTGKLKAVPVETELSLLLETEVERMQTVAQSKQVRFSIVPFAPVRVRADLDMLQAVLRNLFSNAVKYSPSGSRVIVRVEADGTFVWVSVQDFGSGIPPAMQEKILAGRVDSTTAGTWHEAGTGLGLMLAREFVLLNGGMLGLESESGQGTIFRFSIPQVC